MTWTLGLALYGATVSTAAILLHFLRYRSDRPRLAVDGGIYATADNLEYVFSITVRNVGHRATTVTGWGCHKNDGTALGIKPWNPEVRLPRKVGEGEQITLACPEYAKLAAPDIAFMCVFDSHGKKSKLPRRAMKKAKRTAAELRRKLDAATL